MAGKPGARWGELRGEHAAAQRLAMRLRRLADQHGRRLRDLSQVMPYGRTAISDRLSGAARPEWTFVLALVKACVPNDAHAADLLVGEIRPLWEAAGAGVQVEPVRPAAAPDLAGQDVAELVGSMRAMAVTQRHAAEAQLAVTTNIRHLAGLTTLLDYLSEDVHRLTRERDALRQEVNDRVRLREELQATRRELALTQRRLEEAEQARGETEQLLDEALRQRAEAVRLKQAAMAKLADMAADTAVAADTARSADGTRFHDDAWFEPDREELRVVLGQADEALRRQARDLDRLRVALPKALSAGRPGRPPDNAVPEVWGRVPPRNRNFSGRDALFPQIRNRLGESRRPVTIHGLGGVGKTQIAIEYAFRHRGDYDLVWWVPADQPVLARSALAELARFLSLPSAAAIGTHEAAQAVIQALAAGTPYSRWLLIFDNADQPKEILPFLPDGPGHVLITSRNHRWTDMSSAEPIDCFTRAESVEFLTRRIPGEADPDEVAQLAEELGDLPLALEQAGAQQAETGISLADFLAALRRRMRELARDEGAGLEYPLSTVAVWSLAVDHLTENHSDAVELLRYCAFFGPQAIPRDMFAAPVPGLGAGISRLTGDPVRLGSALGAVGRFALARIDTTARTIQVHRLVQALLRRGLDPRTCERVRHEVRLLLDDFVADDPDDSATWPRYASLVGHIHPLALGESRDPRIRRLALRMVRYMSASANYRDAQRFVEDFLRSWTVDPGPAHADVLEARHRLAAVLRELGEFQRAARVTMEALDAAKRPPSSGDDESAHRLLLRGRAADLRAAGSFKRAWSQDEEILRLYQNGHDENPTTMEIRNDLAWDLVLTCDYEGAKRLFGEILRSKAAGARSGTRLRLQALGGLARVLRLCGQYTAACEVGEDAYALGAEELGVEHLWTMRVATDLSVAYRRLSDGEKALTLAEEVRSRYLRLFGAGHPDSLAASVGLANALRITGQAHASRGLMEEVVAQYPRIHGTDHPYYLACLGNLALSLRLTGSAREASEFNREALDGLVVAHGLDHHHTLTVMTNLASDLSALGELDAALAVSQRTAERLTALFGDDHPMTLCAAGNLVLDLRATGNAEAADALRERTLRFYGDTLGADHLDARQTADGERINCDFDPLPL